jgi:hypothetical protein
MECGKQGSEASTTLSGQTASTGPGCQLYLGGKLGSKASESRLWDTVQG